MSKLLTNSFSNTYNPQAPYILQYLIDNYKHQFDKDTDYDCQ
ncbi:MAG TPA: hypothetical protein PKD51_11400 [Saprospiraceae bacterium]|nr:hypothetical protein [Saprospiraceae bacterium]